MEILLLSTINRNVAGILKLSPEEVAVYDPITGKKKFRASGVQFSDELVIPNLTTLNRRSRVLSVGSMVYDVDAHKLYIGDGETAGGILFNGSGSDELADYIRRLSVAENKIELVSSRMDNLDVSVSGNISSIVQKQLAFFNTEGYLNLGTLVCGDWVQDGYFPVDWNFADWGHFGVLLEFGEWDANEPEENEEENVTTIIDQAIDIIGGEA